MSDACLIVVGIGADGWPGLGEPARAALRAAQTIVGSQRQLDLLPDDLPAQRRAWPSPIDPLVEELATTAAPGTCVLASGDPMLHGIGATLARRLGPDKLTVHQHPSAFALACARLGWPAHEVELVSAVGRPPEVVARALQPGRRLIAYVSGVDGASGIARVLRERGYGPSRLTILEQLGGPDEKLHDSTPDAWGAHEADPLHTVAIEVRPAPGTPLLPRTPGLPDDAYEHDGQLTKRHVRALALAALAPSPGQLLWDVGAGAGSIAIEWLRAEPSARAVAIEANAERAERIARNALTLGVPHLHVHHARAPQALNDLAQPPDAIFIGGATAEPGLLDRCHDALKPGGRLVAHAVTLQGEQALQQAHATHGGTLLRIELSHAEPLGSFTGWQPQRPVVQWVALEQDSE